MWMRDGVRWYFILLDLRDIGAAMSYLSELEDGDFAYQNVFNTYFVAILPASGTEM